MDSSKIKNKVLQKLIEQMDERMVKHCQTWKYRQLIKRK